MGELIKKYRKTLSLGGGALFLLIGLATLFWYEPQSGLSVEEARAQANIARMEARMQGTQVSPEQSSPSAVMSSYKERQERNVRYLVIALLIFGVVFLAYGFIQKEEER